MSTDDELDPNATKDLETGPAWSGKNEADRTSEGEGVDLSPHSGSFSYDSDTDITLEKIGRYVLLQKLGKGSFGIVFQAEDEILKRHVALKLLTRFSSQAQVEAWLIEARVLAGLDHSAIVPVYDIGKTPKGQPYIVSKLIDGGSLSKRVSDGTWTMEDSIRVVTQLAQALDYLHRRGVMHRDIKPSNILTSANGDAVLADFGLALPESGYGKGARFVGTPAYMSPEQARFEGHRVDGRSDIYSLGVVLYELLTGVRPFRANNQEDLLDCIRNVEVRPLRQLNAQVPRELERICLKALSKKIGDRYSTAADFAEELKAWSQVTGSLVSGLQGTGSMTSHAVVPREIQLPEEPTPSVRSLELDNVAVVPHGLRAFDAADADFYKFLIPGARDKNGVPESVSFWVQRIVSRDPAEAFRVGVMLGPSGSGKSSVMRAAILPMVRERADTIYLEAKPEQLEENLLKQIRRVFPKHEPCETLRETLGLLRQTSHQRQGKKVFIVIDQFEQWLNHHRDTQSTDLHEALRQCDGSNVQAMLLVRDDFMLGIASFMDQLEEPLLQNHNFATVERFGVAHAQKVLAAFGRAYGILRDPLTNDQSVFLEEATVELARVGRLEPVQIALLSEMIKDKPWTPATLKGLGGIQGLGVAFLEERLSGASAHPLLRAHLPIVRRILHELLPSDETVIKPPACAQSVILDRMGGLASDDLICKLLNLLDTEVRLITPTSSGTTSSVGSTSSSIKDPAYQLTHDYLVPTTRKWLASYDSETRAGRARQQLREVASSWNAKPTLKRLPSLSEWLTIRWFIRAKEWNANEKRMMRTADRRFLGWTALVFGLLLSILGLSNYTYREVQTRILLGKLVDSDTGQVATVLNSIRQSRAQMVPRLIAMQKEKESSVSPSSDRENLHLGLALFDESREQSSRVLDRLDSIEDRYLSSILEYLRTTETLDDEELFQRLERALESKQNQALPLAALLGARQPEEGRWKGMASGLAGLLLRKPSTQLAFWPEMLMPLRTYLVPELLRLGETTQIENAGDASLIASLVDAFAQNDPKILARTVAWAPAARIPSFLEPPTPREKLAIELREELVAVVSQMPNDAMVVQNKETTTALDDIGGHVAPQCAWGGQVPWDQLDSILERMKGLGYRPHSIRPYFLGASKFASVVWQKDPSEFLYEDGLSESELLQKFRERAKLGAILVDFSEYRAKESSGESGEDNVRWIGLWKLRSGSAERNGEGTEGKRTEGTPQVLLLNEAFSDLNRDDRNQSLLGLVPFRQATSVLANGELVFHSLWGRLETNNGEVLDLTETDAVDWTRLEFASGDLYPGFCHADLRCEETGRGRDRSRGWNDHYFYLPPQTKGSERSLDSIVRGCRYLSNCGESAAALELLRSLTLEDFANLKTDRVKLESEWGRQIARSLGRLGRGDELQTQIDSMKLSTIEREFFELQLAVIEQKAARVRELLEKLEESNGVGEIPSTSRDYYLASLAIVAGSSLEKSLCEKAYQSLLVYAPTWIEKNHEVMDTLLNVDFDPIRNRPEWQQLLERYKLTRRIASCSQLREGYESTALFALSSGDHGRKAALLHAEGYTPISLHPHVDPTGAVRMSSAWIRRKLSSRALAIRGRRIASLALALSRLGEQDGLHDSLQGKWGRTVQTEIMVLAPSVIEAEPLIQMLRSSNAVPMQTSLISCLGHYHPKDIEEASLRYVQLRLRDWSASASDGSLMSMARWCLHQWGEEVAPLPPDQAITKDRNWYTNSLGQQMLVIHPPSLALVGKENIRRTWVRIGRVYSMSATEVTGDEFSEFLKDARVQAWINEDRRQRGMTLSGYREAQNAVSWQLAVRYCQWLNEREKIPESEWCYRDAWTEDGKKPPPEANYLDRKGYRLPTHAEWEWACGGGVDEAWHFGSDEASIPYFEWTEEGSQNRPHTVGQLRPNLLGFFDMGGNLAEWNDDNSRPPLRPSDDFAIADTGNSRRVYSFRVLSGGRFRLKAIAAITQSSVVNAPEYMSVTTGFRVARTIEPGSR